MLDRESQVLDLQEIGIPEQTTEIDTQDMGASLVKSRVHSPQKVWA